MADDNTIQHTSKTQCMTTKINTQMHIYRQQQQQQQSIRLRQKQFPGKHD
jgi:hypothetical protein